MIYGYIHTHTSYAIVLSHKNFKYILNGSYNGVEYETISTLRVGWEPELSPFNKNFDKTFLDATT